MATSDVHMHIFGHDYLADRPATGRGLNALVPVLKKLRETAAAEIPERTCLLFDNGDLLQGTPLANQIASQSPELPHPVAGILNELSYDAFGVGNHDLDFGVPALARFASAFDGPVISSNLVLAGTQARDWLLPWAILPAGNLKVGILSVLPRQTMTWVTANTNDIEAITDLVETATQTAEILRAAGADIVVALAHSGIGSDPGENVIEDIALSGAVDAIVGGHTHKRFPGPDHQTLQGVDVSSGKLHGVPLVMPGFAGEFVGIIDLDIAIGPEGTASVTHAWARLAAANAGPENTDCSLAPAFEAHDTVRRKLDHPIGQTAQKMSTFFAQITPTPLLAMLASAQFEAMDASRAGTRYESLPLLSAVSAFRAGGRAGPRNYTFISEGALRERHVADLSLFENKVWAVEVSGDGLLRWLEKAARAFDTLSHEDPGRGLLNTRVPSFDFDQIFGVTYKIDVTRPPMCASDIGSQPVKPTRIRDLAYRGEPVRPTDRFLVATTSYRACGGGSFPGMTPDRPVLRPDCWSHDALRNFIAGGGDVMTDTPWAFSDTCSGLETWLDTSPDALDHMDEISHLNPGTGHLRPNGFLRLPITL